MTAVKTSFKYSKERIWKKTVLSRRTKLRIALAAFLCVFVSAFIYIGWHYYDVFTQREIEAHIGNLFETAWRDFGFEAPEPAVYEEPDDDVDVVESAWTMERRLLQTLEARGRVIYSDILAINPDFLGMIEIPGLIDSQPYVHSHDNTDYLNTSFYGNRNRHGTVFLDMLNDRLMMDNNSIFFGHHASTGGMFSNLMQYKNAATFRDAPVVILNGLIGRSVWIVFSAHITEPTMWYGLPLYNKSEYADLLDEMKARSLFSTDVDVTADDRVITLSVCDYVYENMRFVVHARRLRAGEEIPEQVIAEPNTDRMEFTVPDLKNTERIDMSGTTVTWHPFHERLFFYRTRRGAIERFSGDINHVQGPYRSLEHTGISQNSFAAAMITNAWEDNESTRGLYIAVQGFEGNPGIFLFSASSAIDTLEPEGLITPEDVDARYPAIQNRDDIKGIWLLYSVMENEENEGDGENKGNKETRLYRQQIREEEAYGDPEHLFTVTGVNDARLLGFFKTDEKILVLWHEAENGRICGVWIDEKEPGENENDKKELSGEGFVINDEIKIGARVMLYGELEDSIIGVVIESGGKIVLSYLDLDNQADSDDPEENENAENPEES